MLFVNDFLLLQKRGTGCDYKLSFCKAQAVIISCHKCV